MAQQTRRLRYKWHDFALYQLCRMVMDDNVQSLPGMSAFDDICLLKHVATAIDELRSYPQEAHAMLLAFGGRLYQDLHRDNPNATETELRRATIVTGLTLALCLNCHKDSAVTAATAWLSKGLQNYGDVMAATKSMMSNVSDELIDNISEWINRYWESDERLIDENISLGRVLLNYLAHKKKAHLVREVGNNSVTKRLFNGCRWAFRVQRYEKNPRPQNQCPCLSVGRENRCAVFCAAGVEVGNAYAQKTFSELPDGAVRKSAVREPCFEFPCKECRRHSETLIVIGLPQ